MTLTFGLLIGIAVFALAIGLFGVFVGSNDEGNRRRRSEHEARRCAQQPWDTDNRRGNR